MSDKLAQSLDDLEQTALASLERYQARILEREAQLAASEAAVATLRQALAGALSWCYCDGTGLSQPEWPNTLGTEPCPTCKPAREALAAVPAPAAPPTTEVDCIFARACCYELWPQDPAGWCQGCRETKWHDDDPPAAPAAPPTPFALWWAHQNQTCEPDCEYCAYAKRKRVAAPAAPPEKWIGELTEEELAKRRAITVKAAPQEPTAMSDPLVQELRDAADGMVQAWYGIGQQAPTRSLKVLLRRAAEALDAAHQREAALSEALENLVTKLDAASAHPSYTGAMTLAYAHGLTYNGPSAEVEMNTAKALLATAGVRPQGEPR